jgi:hypothetical protein
MMAAKMIAGAAAFDEAKYPNWSGEWRRPRFQWTRPSAGSRAPGAADAEISGCLPEGERRILEFLIGHYPHTVERSQIDAATNYQRSSRDAYLQRLGARELVEARGREVKASDHLFD